MMIRAQKGFTLLIAVVFSAVVLSLGAALLDIAYKQVVLATSAKQSEVAFYNADSALECALYYDQQSNAFSEAGPFNPSGITCDGRALANSDSSVSGSTRTTHIWPSCAGSGYSAKVTILKGTDGSTGIYADGYSSCSQSDSKLVERGLKAAYGGSTGGGGTVQTQDGSGNAQFTISPAFGTKTSWNTATDGTLAITSGTYTITPTANGTMLVKMWGAGGKQSDNGSDDGAGAGGYAEGTIALTSGSPITVIVGAPNGGGAGHSSGTGISGGSGGGYSAAKSGSTFLLVAGGGGGAGSGGGVGNTHGGAGGAGGENGYAGHGTEASPYFQGYGGSAGTATAGGAGGYDPYTSGRNDTYGAAGTFGAGGAGGAGGGSGAKAGAGGGGAGYYGGGGGEGGGGNTGGGAGGGGGGANYADASVTNVVLTPGIATTPGNSTDSDRSTGGNPTGYGRIVIK